MRKSLIVILSLLCLLIASCVRSLYPLYTEQDLVFDNRLVGVWTDNENNTWTFLQDRDKSYELVYTEQKEPAKFRAHLLKLGGYYFLDLEPGGPSFNNGLFAAHLLPVHTFSRIWIEDDSLRLALFDNDWLRKMIDEQQITIAHERLKSSIILTAQTRELQKLVTRYAEDVNAFPNPGILKRNP